MKKITRFLFCTFVAIMLMGTAISATACHQKEEYPSVSVGLSQALFFKASVVSTAAWRIALSSNVSMSFPF